MFQTAAHVLTECLDNRACVPSAGVMFEISVETIQRMHVCHSWCVLPAITRTDI